MNTNPTLSHFPSLFATLLLSVPTLEASVLIDDFSVDSPVVINSGGSPIPVSTAQTVQIDGQSATRTFMAGATGGLFQGQILNHAFGYVCDPGKAGLANLSYDGFTVDLTATPFLRLDIPEVNGNGTVALEIQSSVSPYTLGNTAITVNSSTPSTLFFDVRTFAGYQPGILSGANTFIFALQGTDSSPFFLKLNGISFASSDEMLSAIPEPFTTGWIAGGLLLFGAAVRRSRRTNCAR
ncbi:MAG: hypothetical protein U1G08_15055 [Verrucomicrobiota bacterium]